MKLDQDQQDHWDEQEKWRDSWVHMFREEFLLRSGLSWDEMGSDADAFHKFFGLTPHNAVSQYIEDEDLNDIPKALGKQLLYVVSDDEGAWLAFDDPGEDYVLWVGTDQQEAESHLCKACNG